jgi:hypothetical protein
MMSNARPNDFAPSLLALALALALAGCASSTFDALPEKLGGLPEGAPARRPETLAYPNVYEPMAPREIKKLNEGEQKSLEQELMAMREQQNKRAAGPPPPPAPPKQAAKSPPKKQATKKTPDTKSAEKKVPDKQAN